MLLYPIVVMSFFRMMLVGLVFLLKKEKMNLIRGKKSTWKSPAISGNYTYYCTRKYNKVVYLSETGYLNFVRINSIPSGSSWNTYTIKKRPLWYYNIEIYVASVLKKYCYIFLYFRYLLLYKILKYLVCIIQEHKKNLN